MALFNNDLSELTKRLLKVGLKSYIGGTLTGSTSTTVFADSARGEEDDYFQNMSPPAYLVFLSTPTNVAPVGESRKITDWANTGGAFTTTAFTAQPAIGSTYVILSEYTWDEIKEALNMAMDIAVGHGARTERIDETLSIQEDTYEYPVPVGFTEIFRISQANDDGEFGDPIPPDQYRIVRDGDQSKIKFLTYPMIDAPADHYVGSLWAESDLSDGKTLRIEGLSVQPALSHPSDMCYLNPNFVVFEAASLLHGSRIVANEKDFDAHRTQAEWCASQAANFLPQTVMQLPSNTKKVQR